MKRFTILLLAVTLCLSLCSCGDKVNTNNSFDQHDMLTLDAELAFEKTLSIMLYSEHDTFRDSVSASDLEIMVRTAGDGAITTLKPMSISYQSPKNIGCTVKVEKDITDVSVKLNAKAALDKKVHTGSTDIIVHTFGAADTDMAADIKEIKDMLDKGVLDYGESIVSCGFSAYEFLQTIGVLEDEQQTQLDLIQKQVEQISDTLDSLNLKLDAVYKSLKVELDKINNTTRENLRTSYASAWVDFKTDYLDKNGGISQQILRYNNKFATSFCEFSSRKTGTFHVYYDVNGNVTLPQSTLQPESGKWLSLDGIAIDTSKTISFDISEDTFKKSAALLIKSIDNETYMNTFSEDLQNALMAGGISKEQAVALLPDVLSAVSAEVTIETMNEKGENGTMADDLIDNFALFCNRLIDKDLNPIDIYHKLIYSHYNFQDEALNDIINFNRFILTTTAQGSAYAELAAKFGSVKESKKASVREQAAKVVSFYEKHDGIVPEKSGAKYCYTTESYLTATQYHLSSLSSVEEKLKDRLFYVTGSLLNYELTMQWDKNTDALISTSALRDIYAVYKALSQNGATNYTFRNYFLSNFCADSRFKDEIKNPCASGLITGPNIEKRSFPLDGSTTLLCYMDAFAGRHKKEGAVIYGPCSYFTVNRDFRIGVDYSDSDASKAYFVEHRSMYSDVMDIEAETFKEDAQLISHAIYAEDHSHWAVAEIWHFVGVADLTNKGAWSSYNYDGYGDFTHIPVSNKDGFGELLEEVSIDATFWGIVQVTD